MRERERGEGKRTIPTVRRRAKRPLASPLPINTLMLSTWEQFRLFRFGLQLFLKCRSKDQTTSDPSLQPSDGTQVTVALKIWSPSPTTYDPPVSTSKPFSTCLLLCENLNGGSGPKQAAQRHYMTSSAVPISITHHFCSSRCLEPTHAHTHTPRQWSWP